MRPERAAGTQHGAERSGTPGVYGTDNMPPWKGKSLDIIRHVTRYYNGFVVIYNHAFALSGRQTHTHYNPGVPLRSAPGCVPVAPTGREA